MDIDLSKLEVEVKIALAKSSFVQTKVLKFLSKDKNSLVRQSVAANLNATYTILYSLSKDKESSVRASVAKNPATSGKILDLLSKDEVDDVRFEVARNENTWSTTLAYLACDKHPVIKRAVAMNKNTPPEALALLGTEKYDFGIKYFVAYNEKTPKETREYLKSILPQGTWPLTPTIETLHNYYDYEDDDWN